MTDTTPTGPVTIEEIADRLDDVAERLTEVARAS